MQVNNIIVTGLPRSGTTLTCHLLASLPNTVALHEPMAPPIRKEKALKEVQTFFSDTRESILTNRKAPSVNIGGLVPDNMFDDKRNANGIRTNIKDCGHGEIEINKKLDGNFKLCIKHNAFFTSLLEELMPHFSCYGIIRNPLSVCASWNSVQLPIFDGHIPAAERLDEELKDNLAMINDKYARQIHILTWFFERFSEVLPKENILRYEDIVFTGGRNLSVIDSYALELPKTLRSKNNNSLYDYRLMNELSDRLLDSKDSIWFDYYTSNDIHQLLSQNNKLC